MFSHLFAISIFSIACTISFGQSSPPDSIRVSLLKEYGLDSIKGIDIRFENFFASEEVQLNDDTVVDYFIIWMGVGGGMQTGYFFDGRTQREMGLVVISRVGVEIEYEIVDINCGDGFNEILIKYGGGGTAYHGYFMDIYRFDQKLSKMIPIFHETISLINPSVSSIKETINYVECHSNKNGCVEEIWVSKGKIKSADKTYSQDIHPVKSKVKKYIFDSSKNTFFGLKRK